MTLYTSCKRESKEFSNSHFEGMGALLTTPRRGSTSRCLVFSHFELTKDYVLQARMFWVTNRVFWIINSVLSHLVDVFIFFMFSTFSKLTPCSSIWDGRISKFVEPCSTVWILDVIYKTNRIFYSILIMLDIGWLSFSPKDGGCYFCQIHDWIWYQ